MKKVALLALALGFSSPAFAYLDPGSGSAIVSAIIGAFVAAGLVIKTYWYKLKSLFSRKKPTVPEEGGRE
jgi:O-antigen/teichoic acid export membrane protein